MDNKSGVGEIAALFFKLGVIGFGGPAAHIAMMEEEVVKKRGWMSQEQFLDLVGVTSIIPGPNSTEMAIHVGYLRGGILGLLVAGLCFIFPAVAITTVFAWLYMSFGAVPQVAWLLYGIKPAVFPDGVGLGLRCRHYGACHCAFGACFGHWHLSRSGQCWIWGEWFWRGNACVSVSYFERALFRQLFDPQCAFANDTRTIFWREES